MNSTSSDLFPPLCVATHRDRESRFSSVTTSLTIEVLPKAKADEAKANEELDVIDMIMVRHRLEPAKRRRPPRPLHLRGRTVPTPPGRPPACLPACLPAHALPRPRAPRPNQQSKPAEGKRHISYTGPVQKGKEWLALGRLSAPIVTPPLKMEGAEEFMGFLAELGAGE